MGILEWAKERAEKDKIKEEEKAQKRAEFEKIMSSNPHNIQYKETSYSIQCPKCGCTNISTTNKKLSLGRAVTGGVLLGPVGAVVGGVTSKKVLNVCQGCGHKWKPKR